MAKFLKGIKKQRERFDKKEVMFLNFELSTHLIDIIDLIDYYINMADKKYKAIFVERDTHHEFMVEARKTDMTADEFLKFLLEFLRQKNELHKK